MLLGMVRHWHGMHMRGAGDWVAQPIACEGCMCVYMCVFRGWGGLCMHACMYVYKYAGG